MRVTKKILNFCLLLMFNLDILASRPGCASIYHYIPDFDLKCRIYRRTLHDIQI